MTYVKNLKEVFAFGILHRPEKSHKYSNARNIYAVLARYEIEKDFQNKVLQLNKTIRIVDFQLRKKFKMKNSTKCQLELHQTLVRSQSKTISQNLAICFF